MGRENKKNWSHDPIVESVWKKTLQYENIIKKKDKYILEYRPRQITRHLILSGTKYFICQ